MAYILIVGILAVDRELRRRPRLRRRSTRGSGWTHEHAITGHRQQPDEARALRRPRARRGTVENAIELKDVEGLSQGQIVRRRFFRHRGALVRPGRPRPGRDPAGLHLDRRRSASPAGGSATTRRPATSRTAARPTLSLPTWLGGDRLRDRRPPVRPGRDRARHLRPDHEGHPDLAQRHVHHRPRGCADRHDRRFDRRLLPRRASTTVLMRFTDLFITFPSIVIGAVLGKLAGERGAVLLAHRSRAASSGPRLARLVRGEFLTLREREFVDAAQGGRREQLPDHPQAHAPQRDGRDHRQHHAARLAGGAAGDGAAATSASASRRPTSRWAR